MNSHLQLALCCLPILHSSVTPGVSLLMNRSHGMSQMLILLMSDTVVMKSQFTQFMDMSGRRWNYSRMNEMTRYMCLYHEFNCHLVAGGEWNWYHLQVQSWFNDTENVHGCSHDIVVKGYAAVYGMTLNMFLRR